MRSTHERPAKNVCPSAVAPLALAALLLFPSPLAATEPAPETPRPKSWSLELVAGPSLGGPLGDLETAMRDAGYDGSVHGCFFGCTSISYPETYDSAWDDRWSYWAAARHRLARGRWHVGLGGGPTGFGTVVGYRERTDDGSPSTYLDTKVSVATLAPMAWFEATRGIRLGAGPALHRIDLEAAGAWEPGRSRSWKPGLVLEAALTVPVDTPVFFAAVVQYRLSAAVTTPHWETTTSSGSRVEFPPTSVQVSHGFVAIGIGGRF